MLPPRTEISLPLLAELQRRGGQSHPSDKDESGLTVYDVLARYFGLTPSALRQRISEGERNPRSKWENRVRWARNALKDAGLLVPTSRGLWTVSESGLDFLRRNRAALGEPYRTKSQVKRGTRQRHAVGRGLSTKTKGLALTENDVVEAVAAYLTANGYHIDKALTTTERGIDIVAEHQATGERLFVEAKGATSSKEATARFGMPFTPNQARSHVSVALYTAAKLFHRHLSENVKVALALPDDPIHRRLVDDIGSALDALGIGVFFVVADGRVTERSMRHRRVNDGK